MKISGSGQGNRALRKTAAGRAETSKMQTAERNRYFFTEKVPAFNAVFDAGLVRIIVPAVAKAICTHSPGMI